VHLLQIIHRFHPVVGGSENYFRDLGERLVEDGHRVTVLTTDADQLARFWDRSAPAIEHGESVHGGVRILRFPLHPLPGGLRTFVYAGRLANALDAGGGRRIAASVAMRLPRVPSLARFLRATSERFDAVHTSNVGVEALFLAGARFAESRGIPHLCTPFVHLNDDIEEADRQHARPRQLHALRRATVVMAQTEMERGFLLERGIPADRVHVVGCWVRPEEMAGGDAARLRRRLGIAGPIVLAIGAAAYEKGTVHLLEAMRALWAEGSEATLVLVAASSFPEFRAALGSLTPRESARVHLREGAPHQEKLDALAAADLLALPSRTDSFGIVFLEAWSHGKPVIGARAGGIPDVITHGEDGLLVGFGEVDELAAALRRLLGDAELRRSLGEAGRRKVADRYTLDSRYPVFRDVLDRALRAAGG
jgi:glycogen synthase